MAKFNLHGETNYLGTLLLVRLWRTALLSIVPGFGISVCFLAFDILIIGQLRTSLSVYILIGPFAVFITAIVLGSDTQ